MSLAALGQTKVTLSPTTTLAAETGNNTSASSLFTTQSDGNSAPGNVSKLPTRNLVYSGSSSLLLAHMEVWYGGTNHLNVGYRSDDPTQVHSQVSDMLSRGIQGAVVDWYGANFTREDTSTKYLRQDAETRGGQFVFALMEDGGALNACATTPGCNVTQQLISDLTYAYNNYMISAAYLKSGGRPLVMFFGNVDNFAIDWTAVRSSAPGNPLFVFLDQDNAAKNGFGHANADGAFSWQAVNGSDANDIGLTYLDGFYTLAKSSPLLGAGSAYKGFNDSLAPWAPSPPRVTNQQCGQTWLKTMAESGKYFSSAQQLYALQLVTWNDYEEATEIETGIDNCIELSAAVNGSTLSWSVSGDESTVDHYTVFISSDGQNLMPLKDVAAGTHILDLSQYSFSPGTYQFLVKAVGKPSLLNHMSNAAAFNPNDQPPLAKLSVTPPSGTPPLSVTASTAGSTDSDGSITATTIDFGDGTVVNGTSAQHTYSNTGSFTVTATVTDNVGLSSRATVTVVVGTPSGLQAVLQVTPTSGSAPLAVSASTANSTDTKGTITTAKIDFGDGTVVTASSAQHTYSSAGTFTVKATVTDSNGASSSATQSVTVFPAPGVTIAAPANGATLASPVHIGASATATQPITSMTIYVDGVSSYTVFSNNLDTWLAMSNGGHLIVVKAFDGAGNAYQSQVTITVSGQSGDQPPVAQLSVSPASGVAPLAVTASTSGSSDPDGTVVSSTINWGDGVVVAGPTAQHTYNSAGTYTVTATVFDNANLSSSTTATVTVQSGVAGGTPVIPAKAQLRYVPHMVTGGGFVTKLTIANLVAAQNSIVVNFVSQAGTLISSTNYTLPAAGTLRLQTPESQRSATSSVQWAVIGADQNIGVNVFFELAGSGGATNVINTIGFNDAPPATKVTLPVEFQPAAAGASAGRTVGLAVANPNNASATVTLTLTNSSGASIATSNLTLPAFGQVSKDLSTLPAFQAALPAGDFAGTVVVSANVPVSALALGDDTGPFFSTTPVTTGNTGQLFVPHVVTGGGFVTRLTLMNLAAAANSMDVKFYSQSGALLQDTPVTVPALGTARISTPESQRFAPAQISWAIVSTSQATAVNFFFELESSTSLAVVNTIGFEDAAPATDFTLPVEFLPPPAGAPVGRTVGLALANPSASVAAITLALVDGNGNVVATSNLSLNPNSQTALDLGKLPAFKAVLPASDFVGVVTVSSTVAITGAATGDDFGPFYSTPFWTGRAR